MNFLLDHDVPDRIGGVAEKSGHRVVRVREVMSTETKDDVVLAYARMNHLILVTCNRDDFVALAKAQEHPGLVVIIRRKTRIAECSASLRLIESAGDTGLAGNINVA